ncbi:MAG TPA: hypothetical protein VN704_07025 [Verrucomicrobiae bacterium]|nr:hypothetical protein [Verrucomicrobiae bacterium]
MVVVVAVLIFAGQIVEQTIQYRDSMKYVISVIIMTIIIFFFIYQHIGGYACHPLIFNHFQHRFFHHHPLLPYKRNIMAN